MTAELVIMNKSAVALAADSAVSITKQNGQGKVFNTANKVFALSKYAPVGIMVSGNASIMGIPWETIIKIYRQILGNTRYDTIIEYKNALVAFLNNFLSGDERESLHIQRIAIEMYCNILNRFETWCKREVENRKISNNTGVSENEIRTYLHHTIANGVFNTRRNQIMKVL